MQKIKTIYMEDDSTAFDKAVQEHMDKGYKIVTANSAVHPYMGGEAAFHVYTAILIKEE